MEALRPYYITHYIIRSNIVSGNQDAMYKEFLRQMLKLTLDLINGNFKVRMVYSVDELDVDKIITDIMIAVNSLLFAINDKWTSNYAICRDIASPADFYEIRNDLYKYHKNKVKYFICQEHKYYFDTLIGDQDNINLFVEHIKNAIEVISDTFEEYIHSR